MPKRDCVFLSVSKYFGDDIMKDNTFDSVRNKFEEFL